MGGTSSKNKTDRIAAQKEIAALKDACFRQDCEIKALYEVLISGEITRDEYKDSKAALILKRDNMKDRIAALEATLANASEEGNLCNAFVTSFQKYTEVTCFTKEIAEDVLKEVRVYPDGRIEVIWNYREDVERLLQDVHDGGQDEQQTSLDLLQDCIS